ncbi:MULTISPECIES: hypothetical protein [unclassified Sphingopyxis]|jgi:hypothetical protein|uniref:hypothetical protein n=1 Tax=unclassified Sphingopyxis TaxID=2614943 RepID=UPI0006C50C67|nr:MULTISPECIES: hypothetical protein [unclassified Sphingopyxis]USI77432.1 hypothetical protein KEC45_00485 [Sphingopyxis sp. USTB-05]GAO80083.1 hypothetical protein SC1_03406 [Sphingopyxis sp. C-1]
MTTEYRPRLFERDEDIRAIGSGLLARSLPREAWTHEAHLGACLWLVSERPDIDIDAEIATIISRYNESVGGVNDDTQGYHDTITRAYVAGVRLFLSETAEVGLAARVNALLLSDMGGRDWPLRFYTRDLLFSVPARRGFVEPDLVPFPA